MDKFDHFSKEGNMVFAGTHLIADFWGASHLDDKELMIEALTEAAREGGAHLLHIHVHPFTGGGVTGVAALAESHISVHTWPELDFVAFDVFMCGDAKPIKSIEVLKTYFKPKAIDIKNIKRGYKDINYIEVK